MTDVRPDFVPDFAGRRVLVFGVRVAGEAVARALLARGAVVELADRHRLDSVDALVALGARFVGDVTVASAGTELIVTSPGAPMDLPLFERARADGIEVIGEVELAWRLGQRLDGPPWLAITGTNGKTTTVRMLESILRAHGLRSLAVGNVGVPIVEAVDSGLDVLAVELSSYQLAWSSTIRPVAAAVLNLAPDHLDWHGSFDAYAQAKASIWCGDVAIGNADDPAVSALLAASPVPRKVAFTVAREPVDGELGVVNAVLVDRAFGRGELVAEAEIRPAGQHNVANALAASALALAYGVSAGAVAQGLRTFVPDPHRNAFVATVAGVDYVDDSKATNPHAANAALNAYPQVVWIAGGQLKGVDIDELVAQLAGRPGWLVGAVLLGTDRAEIAAALARHAPDIPVIDVPRTDDGAMSDVVRAAAAMAAPGDTVLLSPAAASYDMFSSYSDRGDQFARAVLELTDGPER